MIDKVVNGYSQPGMKFIQGISKAFEIPITDVVDAINGKYPNNKNITENEAICQAWDRRVRAGSPNALWYSPLTSDGMAFLPADRAMLGRRNAIEHDVRLVCGLTGVPYLSPHKLRHGHVVYALKQARNMAELKAISQNVMHASVTITDQIYGGLTNDDVRQIIAGLGAPREKEKIGRASCRERV